VPTAAKTRTEPVTATVVVIRIVLRMTSLHRMVRAAVVRTRSPPGFAVGVAAVLALGSTGASPTRPIAAQLERYAGYNPGQTQTYIAQAVAHYCPNDGGKLP